jgi:hypothetical protein
VWRCLSKKRSLGLFVMRTTDERQVRQLVRAAVRDRNNVMNLKLTATLTIGGVDAHPIACSHDLPETTDRGSASTPSRSSSEGSTTGSGSATAGPSGSSPAALMNGPGSSSSASTPTTPADVNWSQLSQRGAAIVRLIVIPSSEGYSTGEIARKLGTTRRWVCDRLDELRDELERLALPR